jgi:hypothetical protein|tara:strand:+ start:331 stop:486 length:156 start_codon:yes stop_codon:yes gene_type:complete
MKKDLTTRLKKSDTHSLKAMVKALSMFHGFFNDSEDNKRLELAKKILKERS